ncbi:HlyD family secretion protein [Desulfovibrio litoralis]|uniref:HlyD family secretion protein n=1 Tax=Desulfovibrio litoralis DSM 11393 TaxID=1121455 RepID=A0A1M7TKZ4_9BACT|nr:biotin/lipoyl-binding protein [Desulfovibrio litoralis]SHN71441.1 HlyD family secretion protein [Desulfovibrio litoralis DSM 11393]
MKFSLKIVILVIIIIGLAAGYYAWSSLHANELGKGFVSGNGRIEATEIDIATKLAGRVESIYVHEGDFVKTGQLLATIDSKNLEAQLHQAKAQLQQAITTEVSARAQIQLRESDRNAALATVAQRESELDTVQRRSTSSSALFRKGAVSQNTFEDDKAGAQGAKAAVEVAKDQVAVAEAAVEVAKAQANGAQAEIRGAEAAVDRIAVDIEDCKLTAPCGGRIQYRIAEPGEVLGVGGKVLNLVDLSDVYMTFFLSEESAGKVALQSDARIILDAAPNYVIPSKITFVSSTAQFTPKTVETYVERQKLMFRVKAQIDHDLLIKHITMVKTGLPGVTWLKLDPNAEWPESLAVKVAP